MKKLLLPILFIAALVGLTIWQGSNKPTQQAVAHQQKAEVGQIAPAFSLIGLDKQTYKVDGARQKPVLINFWASWCGPCQMEAPDLQKLWTKYQQHVDFYAINVTSNDNLEDALAFVEHYKLTFPIPLDQKGEVASLYRVNAFPTTYLIDKKGVIRQKFIGSIDPAVVEKELQKLAAE